jgi:hypothetical protein
VSLFENARTLLQQIGAQNKKPEFFKNPFEGISTAKQLLEMKNDFVLYFQAYNTFFPSPLVKETEKDFVETFNTLF